MSHFSGDPSLWGKETPNESARFIDKSGQSTIIRKRNPQDSMNLDSGPFVGHQNWVGVHVHQPRSFEAVPTL